MESPVLLGCGGRRWVLLLPDGRGEVVGETEGEVGLEEADSFFGEGEVQVNAPADEIEGLGDVEV